MEKLVIKNNSVKVIVTHVNNFERQLMDERILQQESKQSDDPEEVSIVLGVLLYHGLIDGSFVSNSKTQSLSLPLPDCIAVLAGI